MLERSEEDELASDLVEVGLRERVPQIGFYSHLRPVFVERCPDAALPPAVQTSLKLLVKFRGGKRSGAVVSRTSKKFVEIGASGNRHGPDKETQVAGDSSPPSYVVRFHGANATGRRGQRQCWGPTHDEGTQCLVLLQPISRPVRRRTGLLRRSGAHTAEPLTDISFKGTNKETAVGAARHLLAHEIDTVTTSRPGGACAACVGGCKSEGAAYRPEEREGLTSVFAVVAGGNPESQAIIWAPRASPSAAALPRPVSS